MRHWCKNAEGKVYYLPKVNKSLHVIDTPGIIKK